jgi:hypothetical protein
MGKGEKIEQGKVDGRERSINGGRRGRYGMKEKGVPFHKF